MQISDNFSQLEKPPNQETSVWGTQSVSYYLQWTGHNGSFISIGDLVASPFFQPLEFQVNSKWRLAKKLTQHIKGKDGAKKNMQSQLEWKIELICKTVTTLTMSTPTAQVKRL